MAKEINLLVLDDEKSILNSLNRLFFSEAFGIKTTSDHKEAMEILDKENIKVVMSDHRMPEITGVEFLKKVKDKHPDVLRILFTGYADFSAAEEAINIGEVFRFISKPWEAEELKRTVKQAMEHYDLKIQNKRLFDEMNSKNTELDDMNNQLLAMYEKQKAFNSTVSHELRTPLASMKMALDIVLSGTPGELNGKQKEFLSKAKNNVDRLNRLINDILDLSKLESKKLKVKLVKGDINKVINEVVETQKCVAEEKGLKIETKLENGLAEVEFDEDKINQVMTNLVNNAIKFTEKGKIDIATTSNKNLNTLEVRVMDSGIGVKKADQEKLFNKFIQLSSPAKNKTGGTGLGLAICKEIIDQHGGKIWVESSNGKGSAFIFNLPIQERRSK